MCGPDLDRGLCRVQRACAVVAVRLLRCLHAGNLPPTRPCARQGEQTCRKREQRRAQACAHARQVWPAADGLISLAFGAVAGLPELAALAIYQDDGTSFPDALSLPLADGSAAPQDWLAAAPAGPPPAASAPAPPAAPAAGPAAAAAAPGAALRAPAAGPTMAAAPFATSGSAPGDSPPLAVTLPDGGVAAGPTSGQPLAWTRGDGNASAPAWQDSTAAGPASAPGASSPAATTAEPDAPAAAPVQASAPSGLGGMPAPPADGPSAAPVVSLPAPPPPPPPPPPPFSFLQVARWPPVADPAQTEFYWDPTLSTLPALLAAQLPPGGLAAPLDISADPGGGRRGGRAGRAPGDALFTWLAVFSTLPGARPAAGHLSTAPFGAHPAAIAASHACVGCYVPAFRAMLASSIGPC